MKIRFHADPDGTPHIHSHDVQTYEVREALARCLETLPGRDQSYVAIGQAEGGCYLKIIYSLARDGDGIFVIMAYDLTPKELKAFRRRQKRRGLR